MSPLARPGDRNSRDRDAADRSHDSPSQLALSDVDDWRMAEKDRPSAARGASSIPGGPRPPDVSANEQSADSPAEPSQRVDVGHERVGQERVGPESEGHEMPSTPAPPRATATASQTPPPQAIAPQRQKASAPARREPGDPPSREGPSDKKLTASAVLLFPLTLYMLLGSAILYLLYCVDRATRRILHYAAPHWLMDEPEFAYSYHDSLVQRCRFYFLRARPVRWHVRNPLLTLLFPVAAAPLALLAIGCLLWACGLAAVRIVSDAVRSGTREAWNSITDWFS